jgi:hypothetical protein
MQHIHTMTNKNAICSGARIPHDKMSAEDLVWAAEHGAHIQRGADGRWHHVGITERDRATRRNYWKPDTGRREDNITAY